MKKITKALVAVGTAAPALIGVASAQSNSVNCAASFLPVGLCNTFAGGSGFTVSSLLGIVFTIIIAFLVLFILFQIVKAVFDWIGKSGDEKARAAAIKSITNAVIAGIVLIIALLVVVFGSRALNIGDIPALAYGCYGPNQPQYRNDGSVQTGTELSGVTAYEGTGGANNATAIGNLPPDVYNTLKTKVYCKDDSTGSEYGRAYYVGKKVSVQKATATP